MRHSRITVLISLTTIIVLSTSLTTRAAAMEETFRAYWYDQGAEITRYQLLQSRYGEQREGQAVLVYVTEPLSTDGQVKSDDPNAADAVPGLKLNHTRNFLTGIYPYHCLVTILQPIAGQGNSHPLKITTSVQEWCGHVFEQLNRSDSGWHYRLFSYFQSEGDQDRQLADAITEDGLWTQLRVNPAAIVSGEQQVIPGALYRRFAHLRAEPVAASIAIDDGPEGLKVLRISYPSLKRELAISYDPEFPHTIAGWHERSGDEVTAATMTKRVFGPYWEWNQSSDVERRDGLDLPRRP